MKRKHRLGKVISLVIAVSLLLGVTVVGALAEDSSAGDAVAQSETTAFPWDGYTRITMADYKKADGTSIEAPTDEAGKTYTSSLSGTYGGASLHHTYLDVDVKFNGNFNANNYFHYFGSGDWSNNIRFAVNRADNVYIQDTANRGKNFDVNMTTFGLKSDTFFNYKVLTDIVANADGTTQTVTLQFYVNKSYAGTMTWSEAIDTVHTNFYFYRSSGSFSLRTPQPWADYKRITMEDYGIDASQAKEGTSYTTSKSGTYTRASVHKTYLDVDINFEGNVYQSDAVGPYIRFFGISDSDWTKDVWIKLIDSHVIIADKCRPKRDTVQSGDIWQTLSGMNISLNQFSNLKVLTDIVVNAEDSTKNDVRLQYYINDIKAGEMTWTENVGETHTNFQIYSPNSSFSLRTPLLPEDIDFGYDISTYRTTVNADGEYTSYPEKTGYVFGGWYSDVYLTEPLDSSAKTGKAYAKFVQADVLTVKFQKLANASKEDDTTSLRPVTSVDTLDYEYVGFKRVVEGASEKIYKTKSVYKTIKGTVNGETYTYTPSAISEASKYLMALSINNITQYFYDKDITITPVWKTLDGTIVTGTARTIQLFPDDVEGGTTLYGGEEFENDNEAYYKSIWIY